MAITISPAVTTVFGVVDDDGTTVELQRNPVTIQVSVDENLSAVAWDSSQTAAFVRLFVPLAWRSAGSDSGVIKLRPDAAAVGGTPAALIGALEAGSNVTGAFGVSDDLNGLVPVGFTIQFRALRTVNFTFEAGSPAKLRPAYASGDPTTNFHTNVDPADYTFTGRAIAGVESDGTLVLLDSFSEAWMLSPAAARQLIISDASGSFESHFEIQVLGDLEPPGQGGAPGEPTETAGEGGQAPDPMGSGGNPEMGGDGDGDSVPSGDGDGDGDGAPAGSGGTATPSEPSTDPFTVSSGEGSGSADSDGGCGCQLERRAPGSLLWVTPTVLLWLRMRRPVPKRLAWWRKF